MFDKITSAISNGVEKVANAAGREVERAMNEQVENISNDFDSIATAIDEGGLVGGAIQAADVFSPGHQVANGLDAWNVIPEDPALKELVAGGVNFMVPTIPTKLLALKDLADSIGEIRKANAPVPAPSASQAAPAPTTTDARRADGYPACEHRSVDVRGSQAASLRELGDVLAALKGARDARAEYCRSHPDAPVPTDGHYTIDEILNHPTMPTGEVCARVVAVILHEHPEALEQIGAATGTQAPSAPREAPASAEAKGPSGESSTQTGQAIFGMFGQVASFLGPLLGNPIVGTLLGGLLMATPLAPIAPFLPFILPLAGGALSALGGAATQVSQGQDPTLNFGAGSGGPSPDMLAGLLQTIPGMLGGAPAATVPV